MSAIGPCFISPGGVALGVDVRDLLQLERAFERQRMVDAAAEEDEVVRVRVLLRDRLDGRELPERLAHERRQRDELGDELAAALGVDDAAPAAQVQREEVERRQLRRERLRRRDADLGPACV
jgi:hypothetical protein